ncbi:U2 small nuclear ribonucleoprotein A' [Trichomonascus vanleenenianus]|uniref:U2 snRNP complex subunit LEA1 n=1 Tax=Trichomonascus vanleenenianus TaxID=2268995 RepID=UPI003ECA7EAF
MQLTADLLANSPAYTNPLKQRELLLRSLRIPVIENLGATRDTHDAIDFTDNDIRVLGNFPRMTKLETLLLARNKITYIQPNLSELLPNLRDLILTSNGLNSLSDLVPLARFERLTHLSLVDNPVCISAAKHYRLFVIWLVPSLKVLDFQKIKDVERTNARKLFGQSIEEPSQLAKDIMGESSSTAVPAASKKNMARLLSDEERARLRDELKRASTLDEISRIQEALKTGYLG